MVLGGEGQRLPIGTFLGRLQVLCKHHQRWRYMVGGVGAAEGHSRTPAAEG